MRAPSTARRAMCMARLHSTARPSIAGNDTAHTRRAVSFQGSSPLDPLPGFPNLRRLREGSPIMRASCPTKCPPEERENIRSKLGVRSLVDLRTADERHGDPLPPLLWDSVVRIRQGGKLKLNEGGTLTYPPNEAAVRSGEEAEEGVVLYNVPLYTTRRIMRWVLLNAPLWEKPQLLSSLPTVIGFQQPSPDTLQLYNSSLSRHGLQGHNQFLLDTCGEQVRAVLELMCDRANLPMVFFCSLGKDRTGVVSMLALHCGGASREEIREDFKRSSVGLEGVRAEVMASLEKRGLDPEEFISARTELVDKLFGHLDAKYGGPDAYLDRIGFGPEWRERLREVL